jgi:hypothetical protein
MTIDIEDQGVKTAVKESLGLDGPFTGEECQSLSQLEVKFAKDISAISLMTGLVSLKLHACQLSDLCDLAPLGALTTLTISCTQLASLAGLEKCSSLVEVNILFTSVDDATPLLSLENLRQGELVGNPWNEESYTRVKTELEQEIGDSGVFRCMDWSPKKDWKASYLHFKAGSPLCGGFYRGRYLTIKPGIPEQTDRDCNGMYCDLFGIKADKLSPDDTKDWSQLVELLSYDRVKNFGEHIRTEVATPAQAKEWLEQSDISDELKMAGLNLITRFPQLGWFRTSPELLQEIERYYSVVFPPWFTDFYNTIAWCRSGAWESSIKFTAFDYPSPHEDYLESFSYVFGTLGYYYEDLKSVLSVNKLFVVASLSDEHNSNLAINVGEPDDQCIYDFDGDDVSGTSGLLEKPRVAFKSYASFLDHIMSFEFSDRTVEAYLPKKI